MRPHLTQTHLPDLLVCFLVLFNLPEVHATLYFQKKTEWEGSQVDFWASQKTESKLTQV